MKREEPEKSSNAVSDALLVVKAKEDMRNFGVLYTKYYSQIFKFVHKRVSETDKVNDITSQVFLKAMLNLKKYNHQGYPFSSWLYRIALSELGDLFRAETALRALKIEWSQSAVLFSDLEINPEETDVHSLGEALNSLDEDVLTMIEMRYFEKIKLKEIAEIMNISESNAKVKMHRTLAKLKKKLE